MLEKNLVIAWVYYYELAGEDEDFSSDRKENNEQIVVEEIN